MMHSTNSSEPYSLFDPVGEAERIKRKLLHLDYATFLSPLYEDLGRDSCLFCTFTYSFKKILDELSGEVLDRAGISRYLIPADVIRDTLSRYFLETYLPRLRVELGEVLKYRAVLYAMVVEKGTENGRYHIHAILRGPAQLIAKRARKIWKLGKAKVEDYDPARPGALYITKKVLEEDSTLDMKLYCRPRRKRRKPSRRRRRKRSLISCSSTSVAGAGAGRRRIGES